MSHKCGKAIGEARLKLNKEKCIFRAQEIKFFGDIMTHEGFKHDPDKLAVTQRLKIPTNKKGLQRILGVMTYLTKFIKNLTELQRL